MINLLIILSLSFAAKNGVYTHLVENVREAFEACELVRINCQGLNPSDYRKIGAKLKVCIYLSCASEIFRSKEISALTLIPYVFFNAGSCPVCANII